MNGNQAMIDRLVRDDYTLAQKIRNIIHDVIDKFTGVKDPQIDQMKKAVRMLDKAIRKADAVSGVKYSKANEADAETEHIKDQIRNAKDKLNQMGVAAKVTAPDTSGWSSSKRNKWVMDSLKEIGMYIDRQGFGTVVLDENQISYGLKYVNSPAELYAVLAVPKVIKRGIEIHGHENHKYRGFPTVTFAAPVEINGVRGNMGVVVKLMDKKRYKTHRILLPDGSAFIFDNEKAEPTTAQGVIPKDSFASHISSAETIIPENAPDINRNQENREVKYSLPSNNALEAQILAWQKAHQAEIDAAAENDGVSQQPDTTNRNPSIPDAVKRELDTNPIFRSYKTDTNKEQFERAMGNVKRNGYREEVERLLDSEYLSTDDSVEAGALALAAFDNLSYFTQKRTASRRNSAQPPTS